MSPLGSSWWDELSDSELEVRLEQHGVEDDGPRILVKHREDEWAMELIELLIGDGDA